MTTAVTVSKRRFDLSVDWRLVGSAGVHTMPILDELGGTLYDEAGSADTNVLYDEIYYAGPGQARDMHFSKRRFDLTADARE